MYFNIKGNVYNKYNNNKFNKMIKRMFVIGFHEESKSNIKDYPKQMANIYQNMHFQKQNNYFFINNLLRENDTRNWHV